MQRKLRPLLLTLFLLAPLPLSATEGFLFGLHFLVQNLDVKTKIDDATTDVGTITPGGELFLGYGLRHQKLNLGLEVFGNWTPEDAMYRVGDAKIKEKIDYAFGFRAKPGFYFDDTTLFFFELGGTAAHFNVNSNVTDDVSEIIWGFRAGIGFEKCVTKNLCASMSYSATFYGTEKEDDIQYIPRTSIFGFGTQYYFDF